MQHVYSLEHAPNEDPVSISNWLEEQQMPVHHVRIFRGDSLPDPSQVRLLIVMGGPMNIYEEGSFPWLKEEKRFIKSVIERSIPVLGICLGGQLISDILGGRVMKMVRPEYGWHMVRRTPECVENLDLVHRPQLLTILPETIPVFQWHQDTFSIPPGAIRLYSSPICQNQGFIYHNNVIGIQFHPEMDRQAIIRFLNESEKEIEQKGILHLRDDIMAHLHLCSPGYQFVTGILEYLTG